MPSCGWFYVKGRAENIYRTAGNSDGIHQHLGHCHMLILEHKGGTTQSFLPSEGQHHCLIRQTWKITELLLSADFVDGHAIWLHNTVDHSLLRKI